MSSDPELVEYEERRKARLKTLAVFGLVLVGTLLVWKFVKMAGLYGVSPQESASISEHRALEIMINKAGGVSVLDCSAALDDCIARYKVRTRETGGVNDVRLLVAPDAPAAVVTEVRTLLGHYGL